ncbi:MAG: hypothetical protein KDH88_04945 [Chromatiales bacterium]|nr:hypothetical protein [Chromatiales bacterium]
MNYTSVNVLLSSSTSESERLELAQALSDLLDTGSTKPTKITVKNGSTEISILWDVAQIGGAVLAAGATLAAGAFIKKVAESFATHIFNKAINSPTAETGKTTILPKPSWDKNTEENGSNSSLVEVDNKIYNFVANNQLLNQLLAHSQRVTVRRTIEVHNALEDNMEIKEQSCTLIFGEVSDISESIKIVLNASKKQNTNTP